MSPISATSACALFVDGKMKLIVLEAKIEEQSFLHQKLLAEYGDLKDRYERQRVDDSLLISVPLGDFYLVYQHLIHRAVRNWRTTREFCLYPKRLSEWSSSKRTKR